MSDSPEVQQARPIVSLVILVVLGAINVFLPLVMVPKFEQIYGDAWPPAHLSWLTLFLIGFRMPLAFIAVAWPLAGIIMVWRQFRSVNWVIALGILFFLALLPFTAVALFTPIMGMSDTSSATNPASHH